MSDAPRKFLVIIDETPECLRALQFAARRAQRAGGSVLALAVLADTEFQHWLGVENLMREEAAEEAQVLIDRAVREMEGALSVEVERRVVFGKRTEAIVKLIQEEDAVAELILAAAAGGDGPGPLVSAIAANSAGAFPVPITIVPSSLADEALASLA